MNETDESLGGQITARFLNTGADEAAIHHLLIPLLQSKRLYAGNSIRLVKAWITVSLHSSIPRDNASVCKPSPQQNEEHLAKNPTWIWLGQMMVFGLRLTHFCVSGGRRGGHVIWFKEVSGCRDNEEWNKARSENHRNPFQWSFLSENNFSELMIIRSRCFFWGGGLRFLKVWQPTWERSHIMTFIIKCLVFSPAPSSDSYVHSRTNLSYHTHKLTIVTNNRVPYTFLCSLLFPNFIYKQHFNQMLASQEKNQMFACSPVSKPNIWAFTFFPVSSGTVFQQAVLQRKVLDP